MSYRVKRCFCFAERKRLNNGMVEEIERYCMCYVKVREYGEELRRDADGDRMG